ncbi:unnamed protein product [Mytilus edulis]|uniref:Uncharacterized protein n=1 Tax=Mytilus edulis TaxID=6550 RepID=A0A8S3RN61_MYTED|nr:unnamed protein product [Mytilus edulis]
MASKKRKSATVVDSNISSKKSKEELIAELVVIGVNAPASFSQKQLQALLNANRQAMLAVNVQTTDDTEVNDIISKNTIRELSANVKSLTETVKSQGEILKTVVDLQKNATGSDISHNSGTQIHSSSQLIETQGYSASGKVSAVSLLIPVNENQSDTQQIEADGSILLLKPKDHRLQRDLSIHEYIEAFNIYKNIVCEFEDRRVELDMFLQDIIEMATKFKGNLFYEYHKAFAKKVAAIKLTKGLTVDWSIRDEKLYSSVCLGRAINTCGVCGSSLHSTEMCNLSDTSQGKNNYSQQKRNPTTPYSKPQSADIDQSYSTKGKKSATIISLVIATGDPRAAMLMLT